jgi:TatD DNase family protein
MEIFDTHCHFEDAATIQDELRRAKSAGVARIMSVGGSAALNASARLARETALADAGAMPRVFLALGYDRDQVGAERAPLDYSGVSAVGEIGLDYHYSPETRKEQMQLFGEQLELAKSIGKPVVVHTREADDDTLGLLRETGARGIIHCFTGGPQFCRALLDLGMMVSISGIVTFRLADNVRESALVVPDDRLLVETDAPFLAPVPKRGVRNESAFIVHTVEFLAKLRGTEPERLAALTTANAVAFLSAE